MNYNQYEHDSVKGGRRKRQIEDYRSPEMRIQEWRQMTDTVNGYKRFYNFEKWTLKEPFSEITNHTTLNVTYEKVKKGCSIDSIIFHITKKPVTDDVSYKKDDYV